MSDRPASLDLTILYCRAGFEPECAREIETLASATGVAGRAEARPRSAYVIHRSDRSGGATRLAAGVRFRDLVFARQWFAALPALEGLPDGDRVAPVLEAARALGTSFSRVEVEAADTGEGKDLLAFCRKFSAPLVSAARREGLLVADASRPRLRVFFLSYSACHVGLSDPANSSPWFMGIPRLRVPRGAPSRSASKLEEAWHTFVPARDWDRLLARGMRAVDLGASPGGWSWLLARRSMLVTAVDNGPMDPAVLATGLVEHLRVDGFTYAPPAPVDWVLCDMVEQPSRVSELMARWIARRNAARAIFNLKLPMKKRWDELRRCRAILVEGPAAAGAELELRVKHLYHDREEVTAYLARLDARSRPGGGQGGGPYHSGGR